MVESSYLIGLKFKKHHIKHTRGKVLSVVKCLTLNSCKKKRRERFIELQIDNII